RRCRLCSHALWSINQGARCAGPWSEPKKNPTHRIRSTLVSSLISRHPRKIALRTCETAAAFELVATASSHQTSREFAPLGAIPRFVPAHVVKQGWVKI